MASTEFGELSPQARKVWAEQLMHETFGKMDLKSLIGTGDDACIQMKGDLEKGAGDTIKCDLLVQDRSDGVNGDSRLKGFEAALTFYQDELKVNQKRHAHAFKAMSQQRTVHDLRKASRKSLSNWWGWFVEAGIFAHLAGVAGDGSETVLGALGGDTGASDFAGNSLVALDAAHLIDGVAGTMTLDMIDDAVAKAKVNNPRVAPLMIGGSKKYVSYLHPYQVRSLRSEVGDQSWNVIHQNASARSGTNPIYSGALGEYNGVILRESEFIPSVGNVRHGVLLGAGAGMIAFGNAWKKSKRGGTSGSYFDWKEDEDDFENDEGIAGVSILGFKRSQFNSKALGVIGLRSTDAAP